MLPKNKLIVALDFSDLESAKNMVLTLGDEVSFYKIGLEMMMSGCYFDMITFLKSHNKKIFADLKFYDIANTVGAAVRNLAKLDVDLMTIHASSQDIMKAAVDNKGNSKVIAVSVLTNLDEKDIVQMNYNPNLSLDELVLSKAKMSINCGLDGVVSSALRAKNLRDNLGEDFLIVSPGIRLNSDNNDDQKQVADVKTAIENGVSHLVVGRPITKSGDPKESAKTFLQMISNH